MTVPTAAAAYIRSSTNDQKSIEMQLRAIEDYCNQHQYHLEQVYMDRSHPSSSLVRPELQKMMEESKKGLFQVVVIESGQRFFRNQYHFSHFRRLLHTNGVSLQSATESTSPESVMLNAVLDGFIRHYKEQLSAVVVQGMMKAARQCRHVGGLPPIGYSVNMETLKYEINQNERLIVETVFSLLLDGKSCTEIVAALFEIGYRKRNRNPIDKRTVQGILRNEKYTGVYLLRCKSPARSNTAYEEIRVEGGMPVIIPKSMFEDAQEILNAAPKSKSA